MILVAGMGLSGCLHASAKTVADAPPLDVPPPPPRIVETVVETVEVIPALTAPPVEEPAKPAARPLARQTPRPSTGSGRPEPAEARAETPARPETPADPPKIAEDAPRPPTTLQTTPAGAEGEVERAIRAVIARAKTDLNRVDYRALKADGRTQYDTAKRFIQQAEDALKKRNLVFARSLADKALGVAAQLAGR